MADNELFYAVPEITDSFERVHSEMWDMSFELPSVGFVPEPYESAAAEVDMIFIYCGDNKGEDAYEAAEKQLQSDNPICICVQFADYAPAPGVPCSVGKMTSRSDGWVKSNSELIRYYLFTDGDGTEQMLTVSMPEDAVGTPLQAFLDNVLDHAAETYREG